MDENDTIFIFDKVLVPWETVFMYGDVDRSNAFFPQSGFFLPRFTFQGCTRLAVKLDFIAGLLLRPSTPQAQEVSEVSRTCRRGHRLAQLFWSLSESMARDPEPWIDDAVIPKLEYGLTTGCS